MDGRSELRVREIPGGAERSCGRAGGRDNLDPDGLLLYGRDAARRNA